MASWTRIFSGKIRCLQTNADAILELLPLPVRIEAENGNFASGARAQAFQNLHGGGFAGAIGSEQAENLTGLDLEVDSFTAWTSPYDFLRP